MDPAERTPIRICDFKKSDWQKQKESWNADENPNEKRFARRRRLGPVLPAQPKKIEREKGDEPPVIVLLVERPFVTEFSTEEKPERADGGEN